MAWFAGIAVLAVLIIFNDPRQLFASIAAMRFWLIAIIAWHAVPLLFDGRAWQLLFTE